MTATVPFFGPDGALLGTHRKLMPTALERVIWGFGDRSALMSVDVVGHHARPDVFQLTVNEAPMAPVSVTSDPPQ